MSPRPSDTHFWLLFFAWPRLAHSKRKVDSSKDPARFPVGSHVLPELWENSRTDMSGMNPEPCRGGRRGKACMGWASCAGGLRRLPGGSESVPYPPVQGEEPTSVASELFKAFGPDLAGQNRDRPALAPESWPHYVRRNCKALSA